MTSFEWIDDQDALDDVVTALCESDAYSLDTEFHRERTYEPVLALVQVATRDRIALIDPLAVDVTVLARAFDASRVCVMHAASQDLEILEAVCGAVPERLFDTQIAALFCGYRTSSLGKLVEGLLRVSLDKSAQLTDWTRRPLPEADLRYAASDVAHLLQLQDALLVELRSRDRVAWAEEEIERLRAKDRSAPAPETLWWKLRGKTKLNGKSRGVAQELARWRDQVARERNRPPRAILSDIALLSLSQRPPRSAAQLRGIRNFDARRFRHTDALLQAVGRGVALGPKDLSLPPKKPTNVASVDGVISVCLAWLTQRANDEELDPTVLGTRDDVTQLVLNKPSRLSSGWRRDLIGTELRAIIDGHASLRVAGTSLELVHRAPS